MSEDAKNLAPDICSGSIRLDVTISAWPLTAFPIVERIVPRTESGLAHFVVALAAGECIVFRGLKFRGQSGSGTIGAMARRFSPRNRSASGNIQAAFNFRISD